MVIERFYLVADFVVGAAVCLTGTEHHHLSHVMRLQQGDDVELVNGRGGWARAHVREQDSRLTTLDILDVKNETPPAFPLIAAVPLMRPSKLEWVVEKGTELGADAFWFYRAKYSEKESLSTPQMERLRNLTIAAMKQSGRLTLPSFEIHSHLAALFQRKATFFFGDLRPEKASSTLKKETASIVFITGPEKGFSEDEQLLLDQKARGIRLNPHILRAETAPIAALSIVQFIETCAPERTACNSDRPSPPSDPDSQSRKKAGKGPGQF